MPGTQEKLTKDNSNKDDNKIKNKSENHITSEY